MTALHPSPSVTESSVTENPTLTEFRTALVQWLGAHLTPEVLEAEQAVSGGEDRVVVLKTWNAQLADAGWAAPSWPERYGGRDADIQQQLVYLEEMNRAGAPGPVNTIGVSNIAPAIMAIGTEEQKERFLRPMLRGDETGRKACPNPTPVLISPRCAHRRPPTGRASSSTGKRRGTAWATTPTGASCTSALARPRPNIRGSAASWST